MIQGLGVTVLGGISVTENCPFQVGQRLLIHNATSEEVRSARLKAIQYARLNSAEEVYGFVFAPEDIGISDIPQGSEISSSYV